jgi:predicted ATPase
MRLVLKRVGSIKEAMICIDSVTTLAGPNNSGKTTVAKALDALLVPMIDLEALMQEKRTQSLTSCLEDWLNAFFGQSRHPEALPFLLKRIIDAYAKEQAFTVDSYWLIVQLAMSDLITEQTIPFNQRAEDAVEAINAALRRDDHEYRNFIFAQQRYHHFTDQVSTFTGEGPSSIELVDFCRLSIDRHNTVTSRVGRGEEDVQSVVYMPASRFFGDDQEWANPRFYAQLNKPPILSDREVTLETYESTRRNVQTFNTIVEEIIGGKLVHHANTWAFVETAHPAEKIRLGNVASGVLSFAYLAKLIENGILRRNSILIIEEPEMNLHPEWQILFADLLVQLYKELQVISLLISHSPYFIRAIECALAQQGIKGAFYLMKRDGASSSCDEVTDDLQAIYRELYRPFEEM